ncbi:MAG: UvrD-helicase domain-containing protein [Alphaproteobacteria bacterium]|nr:UvrD-helicase domain-containing protein [Alphaproteobacteria bacterium]
MDNFFVLSNAEISAPSSTPNSAKLMPTLPWLDVLNPEQRRAVETTEGPLLVLSGAGTGKTKVLTTRLAYILAQHRAQPWECLVVTFTNRAAKEMKERVFDLIGDAASSVWLGTFHSICVKILRTYAELIGLHNNFTILGEDDQKRLLKQICELNGIDDKKYPVQAVLDKISLWKDKGKTVDHFSAADESNVTVRLYKLYQARLKELNCADFGDLILYTLEILQHHTDVLEKYQNRFKYIMVDEYQDTNVTQYLLIRLLCQTHRNLCCVGDDDQSIYSWRGAEIENILRFNKDFKDAQIIRLERNYRSTEHILSAASTLISHNDGRLGKTLKVAENSPAKRVNNNKIKVISTYSYKDEAAFIAEEIENNKHDGYDYAQMAILVRTAAQTRILEEKFISEAIPYQVIGGLKFYERAEIRDALAYFRVILQPDDDLALERIINKPARGIGAKSVEKFQNEARARHISLYQAIEQLLAEGAITGKSKTSLTDLMQHFKEWRIASAGLPPDDIAVSVLEDSGYFEMLKNDSSPEAEGRIDNLKELINAMSDTETYPDLSAFMEHVSLVMDNDGDTNENKVRLITLHSAKGLEFEVVFLPGWEEHLFPHQRSLDEGENALEEERRLAYVAITRAKHRLFISMAHNRYVYGQCQNNLPSRFIDELPANDIEIINKCSYFGSNQSSFRPYNKKSYNDNAYEESYSDGSNRYSYTREKSRSSNLGKRVIHETFGYGTIVAQDGNTVQVCFDHGGIKKLMAGYLKIVG